GPVHHKLPVRIVRVGAGFEYGHAGPTHHAIDDVAIMRALPDIAVISPADHEQASAALAETWDFPGPVYYRLGKDDATTVPGLAGQFQLGQAQYLGSGSDLAFITMGRVAADVAAAADELARRGVESTVVIVASI